MARKKSYRFRVSMMSILSYFDIFSSCRRSYIENQPGITSHRTDTFQDSRQYESHTFLNPILHFMDYSLFVRCFCVAINCLVITEVENISHCIFGCKSGKEAIYSCEAIYACDWRGRARPRATFESNPSKSRGRDPMAHKPPHHSDRTLHQWYVDHRQR